MAKEFTKCVFEFSSETFEVGFNFLPCRYLRIIKEEGLEISQPALDPNVSEVHHHLTARDKTSKVHRLYRFYKRVMF